jgi:hypothetical protein
VKRWTCPDCRERLIYARTQRGRVQRLNFFPDDAGNVAAWHDTTLTWHARHAPPGEVLVAPEKRYMPHEATCTAKRAKPPAAPPAKLAANVVPFRRRKPVPP